jgi:hypothetical protein
MFTCKSVGRLAERCVLGNGACKSSGKALMLLMEQDLVRAERNTYGDAGGSLNINWGLCITREII